MAESGSEKAKAETLKLPPTFLGGVSSDTEEDIDNLEDSQTELGKIQETKVGSKVSPYVSLQVNLLIRLDPTTGFHEWKRSHFFHSFSPAAHIHLQLMLVLRIPCIFSAGGCLKNKSHLSAEMICGIQ